MASSSRQMVRRMVTRKSAPTWHKSRFRTSLRIRQEMRAALQGRIRILKEAKCTWINGLQQRAYYARDTRKDMELVFLGTSAKSTARRNASCILFKLGRFLHLFDCGEGAYNQFLQTTYRSHNINKIFITHMHGDHVWGLPGFLCAAQFNEVAEIYGPQGLRDWLRMSLNACHGRVHSKYQVHELILNKEQSLERVATLHMSLNRHEDELPGYDISCSGDGVWHILVDDEYDIKAGLLNHNVPCWGYVLKEDLRRCIKKKPLKDGNFGETTSTCQATSSLKPGNAGEGRKVVILGDTCDSSSLSTAAKDADVVVHEASIFGHRKHQSHSTPEMAGKFARSINAKCLVLSHVNSLVGTQRVPETDFVKSAKLEFRKESVILAKDFLALRVL